MERVMSSGRGSDSRTRTPVVNSSTVVWKGPLKNSKSEIGTFEQKAFKTYKALVKPNFGIQIARLSSIPKLFNMELWFRSLYVMRKSYLEGKIFITCCFRYNVDVYKKETGFIKQIYCTSNSWCNELKLSKLSYL